MQLLVGLCQKPAAVVVREHIDVEGGAVKKEKRVPMKGVQKLKGEQKTT